jgi:hypothetical protein
MLPGLLLYLLLYLLHYCCMTCFTALLTRCVQCLSGAPLPPPLAIPTKKKVSNAVVKQVMQ